MRVRRRRADRPGSSAMTWVVVLILVLVVAGLAIWWFAFRDTSSGDSTSAYGAALWALAGPLH
jgi:hypothetical protein